MNQYQFEQIARRMEKRFGKIYKGQEEPFSMMLFPMEHNLLITYRAHPACNSRRLKEAVFLTLYEVESRLTGEAFDLAQFETEENLPLKHALLMSFDPFTNEEIAAALKEQGGIDIQDREVLRLYYRVPVQCVLRILESVRTWEKNLGGNGYFTFLEEMIGEEVGDDTKMRFSIMLSNL